MKQVWKIYKLEEVSIKNEWDGIKYSKITLEEQDGEFNSEDLAIARLREVRMLCAGKLPKEELVGTYIVQKVLILE